MPVSSRLFRRRRDPAAQLPADVRSHLGLAKGERVLAAAPTAQDDDSAWAVATDQALLLVSAEGLAQRRGWEEVDHATWDDESRELLVDWVDGSEPTRVVLAEGAGSYLPEVLRERVQSSVVLTRRVVVRGRRGVRIVVRRIPRDGALTTQVLPDPGVTLDDPAVVPLIESAHREVRAQAGLSD